MQYIRNAVLISILGVTMIAAESVSARMYQWVNGGSGRVQMSGEPPSWYRSGRGGPRVMVFDRGFLVDDTRIDVSIIRRLALRKDAFDQLDERRALADLRRINEAKERQDEAAERRLAQAERVKRQSRPSNRERDAEKSLDALPDALNSDGIARLKAIISAFDQLR